MMGLRIDFPQLSCFWSQISMDSTLIMKRLFKLVFFILYILNQNVYIVATQPNLTRLRLDTIITPNLPTPPSTQTIQASCLGD